MNNQWTILWSDDETVWRIRDEADGAAMIQALRTDGNGVEVYFESQVMLALSHNRRLFDARKRGEGEAC